MNEKLVKELLLRLKPSAGTNISDIKKNSQVEKDYRSLTTIVAVICQYDTKFHHLLISYIKDIFGDVFTQIKPGTIGSYITGCIISKEQAKTGIIGCQSLCAGSIPLPENNDQFCDRIVVQGVKDKDGYRFRLLYNPPNKNNGYVYVNSFQGFTLADKENLQKFGLQKIIVLTYEGKLLFQGDINDSPTPEVVSKNSNYKWWVSLIVIAVTIILLILLWIWYSRRYPKKS